MLVALLKTTDIEMHGAYNSYNSHILIHANANYFNFQLELFDLPHLIGTI